MSCAACKQLMCNNMAQTNINSYARVHIWYDLRNFNVPEGQFGLLLLSSSVLLLVTCFPSVSPHTQKKKEKWYFCVNPRLSPPAGALTRQNKHENGSPICNTSAAAQLTDRQRIGRLKLKSNSCHGRNTQPATEEGGNKCEEATHITLRRTGACR